MQVTVDDLRRRYEAMPEDELGALAGQGVLTEEADTVLREALAARQMELEPATALPPNLPKIWSCYGLAVGLLCFEIVGLGILIGLAGLIYWLWCVGRLHRVLAVVTLKGYPIFPFGTVARHFIPVYNVYWFFEWPGILAEYVNQRGGQRVLAPNLPGVLLFGSVLLAFFAGIAVGLAGMFVTLAYILRRIRPTVEGLQGIRCRPREVTGADCRL